MFFPILLPNPQTRPDVRVLNWGSEFGVRVSCPHSPVPCSHTKPSSSLPSFYSRDPPSMASKLALNAAVSELRFVLCQSSPSSAGTREFVSKSYEAIKKANPRLPVLIREAAGAEPSLFVRTAPQGVEKRLSLANLNAADVKKALESLAK